LSETYVLDRLALGQPDEPGGALAKRCVQPGDDVGEPVGRDGVLFAPDSVALFERAVPR